MGPTFALLGLSAIKDLTMDDAWLIGTIGLSAFNQVGFLVNHQVGLDEFSRGKYISSLIKIEAASKGKWQLIWATSWCK